MTSTPTPEPGERCAYIYSDGSTCDRFETNLTTHSIVGHGFVPAPPPTPVDGDSGRRMETLLSRFAWLADSARSEGFHEAAAAYTVCRDELSDALTPAPSSDTPSDERRPEALAERAAGFVASIGAAR